MADSKLTSLVPIVRDLVDDDLAYVVLDPSGTPGSYKGDCRDLRRFTAGIGAVAQALTDAVQVDVAEESVDDLASVTWEVTIRNVTGKQIQERWTVQAWHDGTTSADATVADYTVNGIGPNGGNTFLVYLNGTGGAQVMRLAITANGAGLEAIAHPVAATKAS